MSDGSENTSSPQRSAVFRTLLVGHDPADPPEATLVLAALAALLGLRADGQMTDAVDWARAPSLRQIADELGLHVKAVRRGVQHLVGRGIVRHSQGVGVELVDTEALATRWQNHRQRCRLTVESRQLGLRSEPLLLVGLVGGQADQRAQVALGVEFLSERLGFCRRRVERALAASRRAGALATWSTRLPGGGRRWQLHLSIEPETIAKRRSENLPEHPKAAVQDVPKRRSKTFQSGGPGHPKPAVMGFQSGGRLPDCLPDVLPDHPPDAQTPARPAGEPIQASPAAPAPAPSRLTAAQVRAVVEPWAIAMVRGGIEQLEQQHVIEVAGMLGQLSPEPIIEGPRAADRRRALLRNREAMARRVMQFCGHTESLAAWLIDVAETRGPANLVGYLRRSAERGGDATVQLRGDRGKFGRRATRRRVFSPETERALDGVHKRDVERIVDVGAHVHALPLNDEGRAAALRALQHYFALNNLKAAGSMLRDALGKDPSDVALAAYTAGICTLAKAREALAA